MTYYILIAPYTRIIVAVVDVQHIGIQMKNEGEIYLVRSDDVIGTITNNNLVCVSNTHLWLRDAGQGRVALFLKILRFGLMDN